MNERTAVLLGVGAVVVSATVAASAWAGACAGGPVTERWELELMSVTVDEQVEMDRSEYEAIRLFLSSRSDDDGLQLTLRHADDPRIQGILLAPRSTEDAGVGR